MAYLFKAWGLDDTLSSYLDFDTWNGNGVSDATASVSASVIGDRADVVTEDGHPALRVRRYAGDGLAGSGRRTELVPEIYSQIYDWVADGIPGALADSALRWYRFCFKITDDFPLSHLSSTGSAYIIFGQLHQIPDTSPADTAGLGPALSLNATVDNFGKYWFTITRNVDPDATVTVSNAPLQSKNVCKWPLRFNEWQDILVKVLWSYSTAGYMEIYKDRRPILLETGAPSGPNNSPARGGAGNYLKMGIYTSADLDMSVYHRGAIILDHTGTFAEAYPEIDDAVPLERVIGTTGSGGL